MSDEWRELIATLHEKNARFETRGAEEKEVAEAERALGAPLPATYRRFALAVGRVFWPVEIFEPSAVVRSDGRFGQPTFFAPFATDGGGNDWCFDLRELFDGEYPIVFWDHEESDHSAELEESASAGGGFIEWLADLVRTRQKEEAAELKEKNRARLDALLRPRFGGVFPYTPNEDEIRGVEGTLGLKLPEDYRWFTQIFGGLQWPLEICDALDLRELRARMIKEIGSQPLLPIARDSQGTYFGFALDAAPEILQANKLGAEHTGKTFLTWLEATIAERNHNDRVASAKRAAAPQVVRRKKPKDGGAE